MKKNDEELRQKRNHQKIKKKKVDKFSRLMYLEQKRKKYTFENGDFSNEH